MGVQFAQWVVDSIREDGDVDAMWDVTILSQGEIEFFADEPVFVECMACGQSTDLVDAMTCAECLEAAVARLELQASECVELDPDDEVMMDEYMRDVLLGVDPVEEDRRLMDLGITLN